MNNKGFTISEVVDHLGINSHTWLTFFLMIIAMVFDGYDYTVVNSTNLFVAHTFWPDNPNPGTLMGSLTTWGLLGMVLGGASKRGTAFPRNIPCRKRECRQSSPRADDVRAYPTVSLSVQLLPK